MYIEGSYNYYMVALSFLLAILASYSTINISEKLTNATGGLKYFWLLSGSIVMGAGIWSMHFVGMMAFHLPVPMEYDKPLTIFSMGASTVASLIALYFTMAQKLSLTRILLGGFFIGSGILAMHYIGMEAMIMPVTLSYDAELVGLSIVIAYVTSYSALFLFLRYRSELSQPWLKWLSGVVMGIAICGMHYCGMEAANFYTDVKLPGDAHSFDPFLFYGVTVTIFTLLFINWISAFFEKHAMEKVAYHDTLTGLPNRLGLNRFFELQSEGEPLAVLYMDLDKFKWVNDTLGHDVGDGLLKGFAKRVNPLVGNNRFVFRIGGDEFVFIIKNGDRELAENLAREIIEINKAVYTVDANELSVTASIGIYIGELQSLYGSELLKKADTAMYRAKTAGKNQYIVYEEKTDGAEDRRRQLEEGLKIAIAERQFSIVYQPKWSVTEEKWCGLEAILHWKHPRLGFISPNEFLPIAEENGQLYSITKWEMEHVCADIRNWQEQGMMYPVSIDISSQIFQFADMAEWLEAELKNHVIDPNWIELEIVETKELCQVERVAIELQRLQALGVTITMDHFGAGYSSIGLLDRLPIDRLKLDHSLVRHIENPKRHAILHAIIMMAEGLGIEVIADGVDTLEQVEALRKLGCHVMQGNFYSGPLDNEKLNILVREGA